MILYSLNDTYFTTQEVNQSFNKNENKTFFTMCLNIRSLVNPHNFNKLECLISELQTKPDIIAINKLGKSQARLDDTKT